MSTGNSKFARRGFTLIEILIVVIILGILASIVIPQFTHATTDARQAGVQTIAQSLRAAVQLYYYQHSDTLPPANNFWTLMTTQSDGLGNPYTSTSASGPFGPYMQLIPVNALNGASTVIDSNIAPGSSTGSFCGWEYDFSNGTGVVHGTDATGRTVLN